MDFQFLFDWLLNGAINFANSVIDVITTILPTSPFQTFIDGHHLMGAFVIVNYFCPISAIVEVTLLWGYALLLVYTEGIVARWVKILKG